MIVKIIAIRAQATNPGRTTGGKRSKNEMELIKVTFENPSRKKKRWRPYHHHRRCGHRHRSGDLVGTGIVVMVMLGLFRTSVTTDRLTIIKLTELNHGTNQIGPFFLFFVGVLYYRPALDPSVNSTNYNLGSRAEPRSQSYVIYHSNDLSWRQVVV